jgi:SAM-dependent methyltransferase
MVPQPRSGDDADQPNIDHRIAQAVSEVHDAFTIRRLTEAWVRPGSRWLEVGAGSGAIAVWLAEQVGATGEVVAIDVNPPQLPAVPGLRVISLTLGVDALPVGLFDGIHARGVLSTLPARDRILATLARSLRPGGTLVIEESEPDWAAAVLDGADPQGRAVFAHFAQAHSLVLRRHGHDPAWAARVASAMRDLGLTEISVEGWHQSWRGGHGSARLAYLQAIKLHQQLVDAGMPAAELDTLRCLAMDPSLLLRGVPLLSSIGRKPST